MRSLLIVLFIISAAGNSFGQKTLTKQPPTKGSAPIIRTPPTFPDSMKQEDASTSRSDLQSLKQEKVFQDLNSTLMAVQNQLPAELTVRYKAAKDELDRLNARGVTLPKIILWSLNEDAKLIRKYKSTEKREYASAAFTHIQNVARAEDSAEEVKVTVVTVNSQGRRRNGFEVCYTATEWVDLDDPPTQTFGYPSKSTENLPKTNWTFWSRDFNDRAKVGDKSAKRIDKDQTVSIGIPH